MGINADGFVEITEMDIAADFTDIAVHLDNLVGGGNFGETINNILNLLGPMIWDLVKGYLFPFLDEILLKVLNDALAGCNIADLVQNGSCFQERLAEVLKIQSDLPSLSSRAASITKIDIHTKCVTSSQDFMVIIIL